MPSPSGRVASAACCNAAILWLAVPPTRARIRRSGHITSGPAIRCVRCRATPDNRVRPDLGSAASGYFGWLRPASWRRSRDVSKGVVVSKTMPICVPFAARLEPAPVPGGNAEKKGPETIRALAFGGAEEDRTPDLRIANATLSQLSYRPESRPLYTDQGSRSAAFTGCRPSCAAGSRRSCGRPRARTIR